MSAFSTGICFTIRQLCVVFSLWMQFLENYLFCPAQAASRLHSRKGIRGYLDRSRGKISAFFTS